MFGWVGKLKDGDAAVEAKLKEIQNYVASKSIPPVALLKMAKFGVAVDKWMKDTRLNATAIQCWTAMEEFFGVVPCTLMSMMSNLLMKMCIRDRRRHARSGNQPHAGKRFNKSL